MKKLFAYCAAITLMSISTLSFTMWRQFTRRVQSVTPSISEALQIYQRDKGNLQNASTRLYKSLNKLNSYRTQELDLKFFVNNPNFVRDLNSAAVAAQEAKEAAIQLKKTAEEVKGESWQKGLVEEPAAISEITLDDDNYLVVDQPKALSTKECPTNSDWSIIDDFDNELE